MMLVLSVPALAACALWALWQTSVRFAVCGRLTASEGRSPPARAMFWAGCGFGGLSLFLAWTVGFVCGGLR